MAHKAVRGIRGATSVEHNTRDEIVAATKELLQQIVEANAIKIADVCSVFFSVTHDLDAEFPAHAARELGWTYTPMLCMNEIPVPGSLAKCIRVLLHVNTTRPQKDVVHVYLRAAQRLRPDLARPADDGSRTRS